MILQPGKIFVRACRVDYEKKFRLADPINDQIVDDSAAFVKQKSVLSLAEFQLFQVVAKHCVQPFACTRTIHNQLAHVRDVENAELGSHSVVFFDNAAVLHRHQPAGERNHLSAALQMLVVKRCSFLCDLAHAPS